MMHRILFDLVSSRLFVEAKTDNDKKFGVQPAMDISKITIGSVLDTLEHTGIDTVPVKMNEEFKILRNSLVEFSKAMENSTANKLLKEI